MAPPTTLDTALVALLQIPAVSQLYEEADKLHLTSLLQVTSGRLKSGNAIAYRIYAAASLYIGSHPERFIDTHDGTKLANWDKITDTLNQAQSAEDDAYFLPIIKPGTVRVMPFATVSLRGFTEP